MKINFNYKPWLTALCLAGATLMAMPSAYAVDQVVNDNTIFELDGNAADDSTGAPDDWGTPPKGAGSAAFEFTGIVADPAPRSIFDGGKKDIQDVRDWTYKNGSVPDKDDITHAYATAYNANGELILYFGADRISNVGDAYMGFWFFKKNIEAKDGKFISPGLPDNEPIHSVGDILILVNFPQANNAYPYIAVVEWVGAACKKAASNNPSPGDCAAENLLLLSEGTSTNTTAVCNIGDKPNTACAITNGTEIDVPHIMTTLDEQPWTYWNESYIPKSGTAGKFPYETFFEGGINLSALLEGDSCFSTFMAETRSSSSFTAALKDFVLDDFELCKLTVTKTCDRGTWNDSISKFAFPYTFTVTNDGYGKMYDVYAIDDVGTPGDYTDDLTIQLGDIDKEAYATHSGTFNAEGNPTNSVVVYAASSDGGTATRRGDASDPCESTPPDPRVSATKSCNTLVYNESYTVGGTAQDRLVVRVDFDGSVCNNTGGTSGFPGLTVSNVTITDNSGTAATGDDQTLATGLTILPATCVPYSGSYYPKDTSAVAGKTGDNFTFNDTITVTGSTVFGTLTPVQQTSNNCPLCPECVDCEE